MQTPPIHDALYQPAPLGAHRSPAHRSAFMVRLREASERENGRHVDECTLVLWLRASRRDHVAVEDERRAQATETLAAAAERPNVHVVEPAHGEPNSALCTVMSARMLSS